MRRLRKGAAIGAAIGIAAASTAALAGYNSTAGSAGNGFATAPDWVGPTASALTVGKSEGGEAGFLHQGGGYHAYADPADGGNPASGVASVSGDIGDGTFAMPSGGFSFAGVPYSHRSALRSAPGSLSEGAGTLTLAMTDAAANPGQATQGFTVDNTAAAATDVQSANGGGTAGLPDLGDTVTFTFSEPIDRHSVISGWLPGDDPRDVVVRLDDNVLVLGNDVLRVYDASNTTQLPLGEVDLGAGDYVLANRTYGATGTKSRIARSGSSFVVTFGTPSTTSALGGGPGTMTWSPSTSVFDRAGNPLGSGASVTESGSADREF